MDLPVEVDKESGIPLYVQLEEGIRLLVHRGTLRPGDPMPTVRTLAVDLGINANTVARVYRELQRDGLLELARGVGTFVAEGAEVRSVEVEEFRAIEAKVAELVRLARRAGLSPGEVSRLVESRFREDDHAHR